MVAEGGAIAAGVEIIAEARLAESGTPGVARRPAIEADEIGQHSPEARPREVRGLAEEPGEPRPRIFDPAGVERHGERHVRIAALDSEDPQKLDKIGVGGGIEDDEASVDGKLSSSDLRGDRIRMAADAP